MKNYVLHIIVFFCGIQLLFGQTNINTVFNLLEAHTYKTKTYRLLKPVNLNSNNKSQYIISLHAVGGRGTDNLKQNKDSRWINYMAKEEIRKCCPCYLLVPQSNELWKKYHLNKFKEIISQLPSVDTNRIYILGHSMGGHCTYRLIQIDPDYFAAAAPSAGSGLTETYDFFDVSVIKNIPIWVFHGDADKRCSYEKEHKVFADMQKIVRNMKFNTWNGDGYDRQIALKMITGSNNGIT